ncbi:MAG: galactokinase, partial [Clostridia bacterium]|nr:galactokinase [Clostridia bacterium]
MRISELKEKIENGALKEYDALYADIEAAKERFINAIGKFEKLYGSEREIFVFSVPGRSEISGNHTDHNAGCVLAGAIDRDAIAIVATSTEGQIRVFSEGYPEDTVLISEACDANNYERHSSVSLIAGTVNAFGERGYTVGGFDAYITSDVLKGSGISSSAAYEVLLGTIMSHLYNDGAVKAEELAKIAQYAENEYFGKPCGLMDQMAAAVGGFVYIDFENKEEPIVEPIAFSLNDKEYSLCIVNTGGNHADLNDDYASVPSEMFGVAKLLGRDVLRGLTEEDIIKNINNIRRVAGDRAVLRSLHFIRENDRVSKIKEALKANDLDTFFKLVLKSGSSSFEYLQNVYSN